MITWIDQWSDFETVYPELCTIDQDCFGESVWSESTWQRLFSTRKLSVGLTLTNDKIIGFLACTEILDEIEILKIGVGQNFRQKGIAKAQLSDLLDYARNCQMKIIHLEVRKKNSPAHSLYVSAGYTQVGVRENYYQDPGDDAVLYSYHIEYTPQ